MNDKVTKQRREERGGASFGRMRQMLEVFGGVLSIPEVFCAALRRGKSAVTLMHKHQGMEAVVGFEPLLWLPFSSANNPFTPNFDKSIDNKEFSIPNNLIIISL